MKGWLFISFVCSLVRAHQAKRRDWGMFLMLIKRYRLRFKACGWVIKLRLHYHSLATCQLPLTIPHIHLFYYFICLFSFLLTLKIVNSSDLRGCWRSRILRPDPLAMADTIVHTHHQIPTLMAFFLFLFLGQRLRCLPWSTQIMKFVR